jgi:hypothetical protein
MQSNPKLINYSSFGTHIFEFLKKLQQIIELFKITSDKLTMYIKSILDEAKDHASQAARHHESLTNSRLAKKQSRSQQAERSSRSFGIVFYEARRQAKGLDCRFWPTTHFLIAEPVEVIQVGKRQANLAPVGKVFFQATLGRTIPRAQQHKGLMAMSSIVELPLKARAAPPTDHRQGLRRLSPDLISKARDETAVQVTRILLAFVGTATFCLIGLTVSDRTLLVGTIDNITVPFAGPVSFAGFLVIGPVVLIVLRIFLQIYVEHVDRLNRIAGRMPVVRAPILLPLQNPLLRFFSGFAFYLLLPSTMLLFVWQAAVISAASAAWVWIPFCLAAGVITAHGMLPFRSVSWRSKAFLSLGAAIIAPLLIDLRFQRPFFLMSANLSAQDISGRDLENAFLIVANLNGAKLEFANLHRAKLNHANLNNANLSGADLTGANLNNANLPHADLDGANLYGANLNGAYLGNANLQFADLTGADLNGARDLTQAQLDKAWCGNAKLPEGLTIKPCTTPPQVWQAWRVSPSIEKRHP